MAKNNLIDIELIKQYVDITEEELMMRLVKDAVGLQKPKGTNAVKKWKIDLLIQTSGNMCLCSGATISTCPSISQTMRLLQRRLVI